MGNKVKASKRKDITRTRYEIKFDIRIHNPSSFISQYQATPKASEIPLGIPLHLVTIDPQGTFVAFGSTLAPPTVEMYDTTYIPLVYSEYTLTQKNLAKVVKSQK